MTKPAWLGSPQAASPRSSDPSPLARPTPRPRAHPQARNAIMATALAAPYSSRTRTIMARPFGGKRRFTRLARLVNTMSLFCSHRFRCAKPSFFTGPQNPRPSAACPGAADRFITTKPGSLQMLDKATSYDLSHELVSVMDPLPPIEAQRKGERGGEVARVGWRELLSGARASADGATARDQSVSRRKPPSGA